MKWLVTVTRTFVAALLSLFVLVSTDSRATAQEKAESKRPDAPKKAEQAQEDRRDWTTKIFQLKHIDPVALRNVLSTFRGAAVPDRDLKVLSWTGPKELAPAVEEAVRRLDVPPPAVPNVELTFYLLAGSRKGTGGEPLPDDLEGVAKQLKGIFRLSQVSLLETTFIRARDGSSGKTEGVIRSGQDGDAPTTYTLSFYPASISRDERGAIVRLSHLGVLLRVPVTTTLLDSSHKAVQYHDASLNTDIELREGQKVVVGKATVDGSADTLFLVATAKVVD